MMNKVIFCIATFIAILSCAQLKPKTNPFLNEVKVSKNSNHQIIKGTKISAIIPKDYYFIENLGRYQKSKKQYIQFVEAPTSFEEGRKNVNRENLGKGLIFFEETKFNSYTAIFAESENKETNENDLILIFGDSEFIVMVMGKTELDKASNREELISIIKSIYYDK